MSRYTDVFLQLYDMSIGMQSMSAKPSYTLLYKSAKDVCSKIKDGDFYDCIMSTSINNLYLRLSLLALEHLN